MNLSAETAQLPITENMYVGIKVQVSEHQDVSPKTDKQVKGTLSTSVIDHMMNCDHAVAW